MRERRVELRSDTFTRPTSAMRRAMYEAEVGDDVWNEDPTVHALEGRAASLLGKEAALFVSSGTQGNLIALLSHTSRGDEVILGKRTHIFISEAAGSAVVGGLQLNTLVDDDGMLRPDDVRAAIRSDDPHHPRTGVLALENTHAASGGMPLSPDYVTTVAQLTHDAGIPVHVDGARFFNASVALGVPPAQLAAPVDSVSFCLSKGLGAPVGSLLVGNREFIARAYRWRKLLGGAMRQVGVLAAAGLVALDQHIDRLAEDHANAHLLAEGLASLPGVSLRQAAVPTNMVFFDVEGTGMTASEFVALAGDRGVLVAEAGTAIRAVTSYEVTRDDIEYALQAVQSVVALPASV